MKPVQNNKYLIFCADNCSETMDTKGGVPICHVWDGEPKFFQNPRGETKALHTALKLPQGIRHLLCLIMFRNYLLHLENCMSVEICIYCVSL